MFFALVAGLGVPTEAPAQQFTNFYVFGDSLSDAGTYRFPVDGALFPLKFTVNPYPVWNQVLGAHLSIAVSPYLATDALTETSTVVGGNNYAQGGACVNSGFSLTECPVFPLNTLGEAQQIGTYLASTGRQADPNALYSAWAGANNIFAEATLIEGGKPVEAALTSVAAAAQDHVRNIRALSQAGARYIIVPNLPNIALTPAGATPEAGAYYAASVGIYNAVLNEGLAKLGGSNLIYADMYRVLTEVYVDPTRYGLTNVTGTACTTSSAIMSRSRHPMPSSPICSPMTFIRPRRPMQCWRNTSHRSSKRRASSVFSPMCRSRLVRASSARWTAGSTRPRKVAGSFIPTWITAPMTPIRPATGRGRTAARWAAISALSMASATARVPARSSTSPTEATTSAAIRAASTPTCSPRQSMRTCTSAASTASSPARSAPSAMTTSSASS